MSKNRDLMDIRNLGEFAFAMSAIGLVLALIAFVAAAFALALTGIRGRFYFVALSTVIWIVLNVPVYRALRRRTRFWVGEQRATKQITYVEVCSVGTLVVLSLLAGETTGARELIRVLEYLFSFWILALLVYQVLLHFVLGYSIFIWDAIRWSAMFIYTVLHLFANSS